MWYTNVFAVSSDVGLQTVVGLQNTLVAHVSNSPLEHIVGPLEQWRSKTAVSSEIQAHLKTIQLRRMQKAPEWNIFVIETVVGWYTLLALVTHSAIIFYSILGLVFTSVCAITSLSKSICLTFFSE